MLKVGNIDLDALPKRRLSELEKEVISLLTLKWKIERERSQIILNKGMYFYVVFVGIAIFGILNNVIPLYVANLIILAGIAAAIISFIPYMGTTKKEEKELVELIDELTGKKQ
ncbi:MAG: hypothetical protein V1859_09680 [archaeon]